MRSFIAVNIPAGEKAAIWDAAAPLREADLPVKWVAADSLHITIKFLGEISSETAAEVGEALSVAVRDVRAFDVAVGGFGAFPNAARPRVVWCGVEAHPALELLANDVERALHRFEFVSELLPFRPHVTLGRAQKDAKARELKPLSGLMKGLDYASMIAVRSVDLMESVRGPSGSKYAVRHSAPLRAGEA